MDTDREVHLPITLLTINPHPTINNHNNKGLEEGQAVYTTAQGRVDLHLHRFQCTKRGNLPIILVILEALQGHLMVVVEVVAMAKARL